MTETPKSPVVLARVAMAGMLFFVFVMYIAFVFIQPELNPLYRFGSEYSAGRMGWLMKLAFFLWGGGLLALALAMAKGLDTAARSRTAIIHFVFAGFGVAFAGLFDSDLQVLNEDPPPVWVETPPSDEQMLHDAGGFVGLISQMVAAGFATRRLRLAGRLGPKYLILRVLSWFTPAAFIAFALFFVSYGLAGLGQRIFLAMMFAWQIIAAHGLATGAFASREH
jgi:hypothetical protein